MQMRAAGTHNARMELAALMARATLHSIPSVVHNPALAETLSEQALTLARSQGDKSAQAKILWNMVLQYSHLGAQYQRALQAGEQALIIAQAENLREQTAYLWNDMALLLAWVGQMERARAFHEQARAMWHEFNNVPMLADNYSCLAMLNILSGDYDAAIQASKDALHISREIDNLWGEAFAQTWVGEAYMATGDLAGAMQVMENAIQLGERVFPPTLVLTRSMLARLLNYCGETERALEIAQQALGFARAHLPIMHTWVYAVLVGIHLQRGENDTAAIYLQDFPAADFDPQAFPRFEWDRICSYADWLVATRQFERAVSFCEKGARFFRDMGFQQYLQPLELTFARALMPLGRDAQAMEILQTAQHEMTAQNAQWYLWQALARLASIHTQHGDSNTAQSLRAQADEIISSIAARAPETLRAGFLAYAAKSIKE